MKNLLDRLITNRFTAQLAMPTTVEAAGQHPFRCSDQEFVPWGTHGLQDFDPEFWLNLSEHPFLMTPEGELLQ